MPRNVVFIDRQISNYQALINSLNADSAHCLLDPNMDGIQQMLDFLRNDSYGSLDSIQLVSPSAAGSLQLGSTLLNSSNLGSYTSQLGMLGNYLSESGDVLLFGSKLASTSAGKIFINSLASNLQADVAASDDLTGSTMLGGDWELEYSAGSINTPAAFLTTALSTLIGTSTYDSLIGSSSNDYLIGLGGSDTLDGGAGNDTLDGGSDGDSIQGGVGDDLINGGSGKDSLYGGEGNDTLDGGTGIDNATGGAGDDVIYMDSAYEFGYGGTGNDTYYLTLNESPGFYLNVVESDDPVGHDVILLSLEKTPTTTIYMPPNVEELRIAGAAAYIAGQIYAESADIIIGSAGNDTIVGYGGDDTLSGGAGNDHISGGRGNDLIDSGSGSDIISIDGSSGHDTLFGGAGDSIKMHDLLLSQIEFKYIFSDLLIYFRNYSTTLLIKNYFTDSGLYSLTGSTINWSTEQLNAAIAASIPDTPYTLTESNDTYNGSWANEWVSGLAGNDYIATAEGNDTLDGGTGNDSLIGGSGDDSLYGGEGNDSLDGGSGADSMIGGKGNDTYKIDHALDAVIELAGDGSDTVISSITSYILNANLENLQLMHSATSGVGNELANILTGNFIGNYLDGQQGNDTLFGNAGDDSLYGRGGNDVLDGGSGADLMIGGTGYDTYVVDDVLDSITEKSGEGIDTVITSVDNYSLGSNLEYLTLTDAAITGNGNAKGNRLTGNELDNVLNGKDGNDTLVGAEGQDTLNGGLGADYLSGGAGADSLQGDSGNDTLLGEAGADTLTGGTGKDIFRYMSLADSSADASARDVITDFVRGIDLINLSALDADSALAGNQAFTGLISKTATFTAAGQLQLLDGVLYANTDGDADAEFSIQLLGISSLGNSDFIL